MRMTCPACASLLELPDKFPPGTPVCCPRCNHVFELAAESLENPGPQVPAAPELTETPAPTQSLEVDSAFSEDLSDPPRGRKLSRKSLLATLIGGVVVIAAVVLIVVLTMRKDRPAAEGTLLPDASKSTHEAIAVAEAAPTKAAPSGKQWQADASLFDLLAAETTIEGAPEFAFRPPKGYTPDATPEINGTVTTWSSPDTSDGRLPLLLVNVSKRSVEDNLETEMKSFFAILKALSDGKVADFTLADAEEGTVNGIYFRRARVTGTSREYHDQFGGFIYMTALEHGWMSFYATQAFKDDEKLRLMENAVLTVHRREKGAK
jgi:hypothetical protein